ncbi:MAG: relaxase/mobilization nuclease domain-containing protein [Lactococcus lactis]|nr:relaxase/mobilization nuclease domain-containing protein [Lactococcus lactis]MDN6248474.1 relaxase/mobilization nuclease domain-containing protein [Lactococcus lactis]
MATTHIKRSSGASRLVNYAEKRAVQKDGHNINIDYAKSEFKQVRELYGNKGSTQAYASRVAFSPKEFDPQNTQDQIKALEIAKEIYSTAYPNQQVALYVHNDTNSLHVHAVIGAIDLQTGKKMHGNWQQYREKLVKITDKVVERHGLEVTIPKHKPEKRSMAEIKMKERGQVPWKDKIRQAIDTTMRESHISDFKSFKEKLGEFAINVIERGRDLTYGLTGTNYKARGAKLGDDYKKETIFNELDRRNERKLTTTRKPILGDFDFGEYKSQIKAGRSHINNERSELNHKRTKKQTDELSRARRNARNLESKRAKTQPKGPTL